LTVHIILLLAIMLLGFLTYALLKPSEKVNKRFIISSFFMVFIVQALRADSVGTDTEVYEKSFYLINRAGFDWHSSAWEPCYLWLNMLIGKFTDNPQYLLAVCSAIILTGIGLFIYKNMDHTKSAFWPVFFFMVFLHYLNSMNLLRQYLAMAFVLQIYWVLRDVEGKKKYIISIALLVVGVNFHIPSIIAAILFAPYIVKTVRRRVLVLIGLGVMIIIVLFSYLVPLIYIVFPQYIKYSTSSYMESDGFGPYYIAYALLILALIIYVFTLSPEQEENKPVYRMTYIAIISLGLLLLKNQVVLAQRTGYYFDIFIPLLIPEVVNRLGRTKTIIYFMLIMYGVLCFISTVDSEARGCYPYLFFWQ